MGRLLSAMARWARDLIRGTPIEGAARKVLTLMRERQRPFHAFVMRCDLRQPQISPRSQRALAICARRNQLEMAMITAQDDREIDEMTANDPWGNTKATTLEYLAEG